MLRIFLATAWGFFSLFNGAQAIECHPSSPEFVANWVLTAMHRDLDLAHEIDGYLPKTALGFICQEALSRKWRDLATVEPLYRHIQSRFEADPTDLTQRNEDFNQMIILLDKWIRDFSREPADLQAALLEVGLAVKSAFANRVCTLNSVYGLRLDGCRAFLTYYNTFYSPVVL